MDLIVSSTTLSVCVFFFLFRVMCAVFYLLWLCASCPTHPTTGQDRIVLVCVPCPLSPCVLCYLYVLPLRSHICALVLSPSTAFVAVHINGTTTLTSLPCFSYLLFLFPLDDLMGSATIFSPSNLLQCTLLRCKVQRMCKSRKCVAQSGDPPL